MCSRYPSCLSAKRGGTLGPCPLSYRVSRIPAPCRIDQFLACAHSVRGAGFCSRMGGSASHEWLPSWKWHSSLASASRQREPQRSCVPRCGYAADRAGKLPRCGSLRLGLPSQPGLVPRGIETAIGIRVANVGRHDGRAYVKHRYRAAFSWQRRHGRGFRAGDEQPLPGDM